VLNYCDPVDREVDLIFQALGDPTRRLMLDRLSHGPASVSELARPLEMSLPAVVQHLHVLEGSGLVRSRKVGRVRTCSLEPTAVRRAESWLSQRRRFWEESLDRLGQYLAETAEKTQQPETTTKERKR
jgi:DNA-binding transcriptional ArsR family regulator